MKNFKTYAVAALIAGAGALPIAGAQAEGYAKKDHSASTAISSQTFSKLDTDRSGTLSETEYSQDTSASVDFDKADSNSDGTLTLAEAQSLNAATKSKTTPMTE